MEMKTDMMLLWSTFIFLVCSLDVGRAEIDFLQQCGKCKCTWKSGKKNADCSNKSLGFVPTDLSPDMQVLDLSDNVIPEIRKEEFYDANLQNLHKIFIKNSSVEELNKDAFQKLAILIELDLSNNLIKKVPAGIFDGLTKIRTVILNNNQIERIEDKLFVNLKFLHKIELRNNQIRSLGQYSFVDVPALSQIELENNRLQRLRRETFINLDKLTSLSLGGNLWNCTCALKNFRDFSMERRLYTSPTACSEPFELKGKLWSDIPSEHFACRPKILSHKYVKMNENVTFTCRIKGSPSPDIVWLYNKRTLNQYDQRIRILNATEYERDNNEIIRSELKIYGLKHSDRGAYVCKATNRGGTDEEEMHFDLSAENFNTKVSASTQSDFMLIIIFIVIGIMFILLVLTIVLFCFCRKSKRFKKNNSMSENGLVVSKLDKSQNDSILEGGSVIVEMQKSLLTDVNPIEKPPRRTDLSPGDKTDFDDGHDVKKTLLEETGFSNQDEETSSVALSDTVPRSRATYVDDGYGTNLPPDLLSFPSRFPQSPSIQSSLSNIHDGRIYGKSPLSSPIYQHSPTGYNSQIPAGFRTLQHPKTGRLMGISTNRSNSPFTPGPLIYPQVVMKQGYVTIPRKPRTPSWTPSVSSAATELLPPTSPTSLVSQVELVEPVYDNLGLRTTASGNSILNVNKAGTNNSVKYTMKDRPLPATPSTPQNPVGHFELNQDKTPFLTSPTGVGQSELEPLYSRTNGHMPNSNKLAKIPPRPPPKPKKKVSVSSNGVPNGINSSSTSKLFDDEGEDGTEV